MIVLRRAALVLALAGAALGCGDDAAIADVPCAIADESCRRAVFALTARIRAQQGARMPPTRIITRQQYIDETRAEVSAGTPSLIDLQFTAALRLLHFLPEGSSSEEASADSNISGVAAYYRNDTKAVTIIADAAEKELSGSLTLSHEYVHALQDAREGLSDLSADARSTDEVMAINALVEGEATILADAAMREAQDRAYELSAVLQYVDQMRAALLEGIEASPAPFNEGILVLPYPVGGRPLAQAYAREGIAGVQGFFSQLPTTLASWVDTSRVGLPLRLSCETPEPPASYQRIAPDRLGVTGLIALETVLGATGVDAFERARSWTNDSFVVFVPSEAQPLAALAWRIGLVDVNAASGLEARLRAANLGLSVERQGNEIILTAATDPALLASWSARNACATQKSLQPTAPLIGESRRWFQRWLQRVLADVRTGAEGGTRTRMP
jgi:hypothetical protein